jgi:hypothetical protein
LSDTIACSSLSVLEEVATVSKPTPEQELEQRNEGTMTEDESQVSEPRLTILTSVD